MPNAQTHESGKPKVDMRKMLLGFEQLVSKEMTPPQEAVCHVNVERYSIDWDEVVSRPKNKPKVVMLRRMVSKVFRELGFSLSKIGQMMERDHGTVLWNIKVMDGMLDVYPDVRVEYKEYKRDVSEKISNPAGGQ